MFRPQLIHKTVPYLLVLSFSLALSGCQSENNIERLKSNPVGVDSTQITSNSTSQSSSSATSNTTSTNTSSTNSSHSTSSSANSSNTTSSSPAKVPTPSPSGSGSSSKVKTPITPKKKVPLSSEHYEWQEGVFKYETEYSNRCVFPQTEEHAKGTMLDELFAWRDIVQRSYLLSNEVIDLDPRKYVKPFSDYDSYVDVMTNKDSYLQKLRSFVPKESGELKHDPYEIEVGHPRRTVTNFYNEKPESFTFGIEWKRISDTVPRDFRVKFILKNSPASKAIIDGLEIKRGDRLLKVNNIDFVNNNNETTIEQILEALKPKKINESTRLTFQDKDTNRSKSVVLKSFKEDETNDLHVSKIIETESGNVGYLHIGANGHIIMKYNTEIEKFRKNDVKDVIVDMRYFNEREYWWTESRAESSLAFMIVGENKTRGSGNNPITMTDRTGREHEISDSRLYYTYRARGKFKSKSDKEKLKPDTKLFHRYDDVVFNSFCPTPYRIGGSNPYLCTYGWYSIFEWTFETFFSIITAWSEVGFIPFSTLNLDRVFILVSRETCSMAEAFINAFRGVDVEVILVGENTCGDPYARRKFSNCGISIWLTTSRYVNDKLFGNYEEGFKPKNSPGKHGVSVSGCYVKDDLTKPLGDKDEALLAAALQYRNDKTCPSVK